ncbi:MAG: carbamoyl-phosphate synthase large subunit, partial [Verrucomicrobiales bacterium]
MPKDTSLHKILLIGSGPIVIGQGCEFDYSGVQACKALREEGYEVVLINSNPATIMTDPEFAARTYIEPITPDIVEKIIIKERPDALLPTLGGQTALNTAMALVRNGVLEKYGVRLIGANAAAIHKGEDRQAFKDAMIKIGLDVPRSGTTHTAEEARAVAAEIGAFPLIIRPAFTLGGSGGGIAYNKEEFDVIVARGLDMSPVSEVLIEESLLGWKEFEMEVMRDRNDNCVVVCSIENFDPMGVHTGDSITVAPIQTLTDREYQIMRDASFAVIREIGVETGGSNIQFATDPKTGRMIVIEMNPRVSRSSALASKATGFPIAKIAAKLAVGYTLDEIRNDITRETPASFEPTIDYVVTKVPRFTFEKFPDADATLTTQMKSVGEAMAIGRTFKESLQKALRSLETGRFGLGADGKDPVNVDRTTIERKLSVPNAERVFWIAVAMRYGLGRFLARDAGVPPVRTSGVPPEHHQQGTTGQDARGTHRQDSCVTKTNVFTGFAPDLEPVEVAERRLPHWAKPGATYFVTFRLADALPAPLLRQWENELENWLAHHPKPWDSKTAYEYQTRFVDARDAWLDAGHGSCFLKNAEATRIVAEALRHFDGDRYVLDAFVVMPNHVHVLVKALDQHSLSEILHSWKSFTAKRINLLLGRKGVLWMDERYDRIVRDVEELAAYRAYISANPNKANLREGEFVVERKDLLAPASDAGVPPVRTSGVPPEHQQGMAGQDARGTHRQDACVTSGKYQPFTLHEIYKLTFVGP